MTLYIEHDDRAAKLLASACTITGAGRLLEHTKGFYVANDRSIIIDKHDTQRMNVASAWLDGIGPEEMVHSFHVEGFVTLAKVDYFEHLWQAQLCTIMRERKAFNRFNGEVVYLDDEDE